MYNKFKLELIIINENDGLQLFKFIISHTSELLKLFAIQNENQIDLFKMIETNDLMIENNFKI